MEIPVTGSSSRRERERLARRSAMLDAALAVFGEKGYEGATIDEVAERAEFGKGTLYNYFPGGKDELYFTLFDTHVLDGIVDAVERAFPDPDEVTTAAGARVAFERMVHHLIAHFEASRSVLLLFMRDGHRMLTDPERMSHVAGRFERVLDAVEAPVARAIAAGSLRPLPSRPVAHLLMGNVRGYLMSHLDADCAPAALVSRPSLGGPADAAAFITTCLFDGLLAPATPAPDPA